MQRKRTDKSKTPEKKRSSIGGGLIDQQAQKVRNQDSAVRNDRDEREQSKKEQTSTHTSSPTMKGFNKGKITGEATFGFGKARSSTFHKGKTSLDPIIEEEETTPKPTGGKT